MTGSLAVFTSCDDDDKVEAPRLFSPVVKVTTSSNSLVCKWQGINGAVKYQLTLKKETPLIDENGENKYETVDVIEVPGSPYTFEDLDWDDRYRVDIKAVGEGIESLVYNGEAITISYPTKLKSVSTIIDTGVKIEWNEDDKVAEWTDVAYINVFTRNEDGTVTPYLPSTVGGEDVTSRAEEQEEVEKDPIVAPEENPDYYYTLTEDNIRNSYCDIYGLQPGTEYRIVAYNNDGEYRGRRDFKTKDSEVYENPDLVVDLRNSVDSDTITGEFMATLPERAIVVLKGGHEYIFNKTTFPKSVTLTTGMSLSGKATLRADDMVILEENTGDVKFENVRLRTNAKDTGLDKNFGGKYTFSQSKQLSGLNSLVFENVELQSYRGVIRVRDKASVINNITFNNCQIDSIADYCLLNVDVKDAEVRNLNITNSTITHVSRRVINSTKSAKGLGNVNIANCTIAYCVGDDGGGKSYNMFELGGADFNVGVIFNMSNCIVGPGFMNVSTNAPFGGLTQLNGGTYATVNVYMTSDAQYAINNAGEQMNPFPAVESMTEKSTDVWADPLKGDFSIKSAQLPCAAAGDPRWHVQ